MTQYFKEENIHQIPYFTKWIMSLHNYNKYDTSMGNKLLF
jgi:hypothetical protein